MYCIKSKITHSAQRFTHVTYIFMALNYQCNNMLAEFYHLQYFSIYYWLTWSYQLVKSSGSWWFRGEKKKKKKKLKKKKKKKKKVKKKKKKKIVSFFK